MVSSTTLSLSWPGIVVFIGTAALLWFLISTYISYKRLAHIPGPLIAALTPWWLAYNSMRGRLPLAMDAQFKKYGSPIRIAPNTIATCDPTSFRLWTNSKSNWTRGEWYDGMTLERDNNNVFSMREEKDHLVRRRMLTPGYQGVDVPTIESDIDAEILKFMQVIDRFAADNQSFDLSTQTHYLFLDILSKIAFGESLGYLHEQKDLFDFLATTDAFYPAFELTANHPTLRRFMQSSFMQFAAPKKADQAGLGAIMGFASRMIKQRFTSGEDKPDMLGSFIRNGLTAEQMEAESLILIIAGTDSTATALRITLLHIMTNAAVYNKLRQEIDTASATVTTPVITNAQAQALPYLKAVILEGMRIVMPLQGLRARQPPPGGAEMEGVWVPHETQVGFAGHTMLHRKDLFGDDADTFNPERWLGDAAKVAQMERDHNIIFGGGSGVCLGKGIALMELRKVIFEIFRTYDLVVVNALQPVKVRSHGVMVLKDLIIRAHVRHKAG